MTTDLQELLDSNRRWAAETEQRKPGFFTSLLAQQAPQYLWIGCADSRVPADEAARLKALCELNVLEQSLNTCETTVVQDAWQRGQSVVIHGWVYGIHNGLLQDLNITAGGFDEVMPAYTAALEALKRRYA